MDLSSVDWLVVSNPVFRWTEETHTSVYSAAAYKLVVSLKSVATAGMATKSLIQRRPSFHASWRSQFSSSCRPHRIIQWNCHLFKTYPSGWTASGIPRRPFLSSMMFSDFEVATILILGLFWRRNAQDVPWSSMLTMNPKRRCRLLKGVEDLKFLATIFGLPSY